MEGFYKVEDYFSEETIHGAKAMALGEQKLSFASMKDKSAQREAWDKSYKVIMVRNPFDRIVSAYVDKLIPGAPGFSYVYALLSRKINEKYKQLRHDIHNRSRTDDGTATFEDFVNYLVDIKEARDPHWQFYHKLCMPCQSHYDYIIKFETLRDDIEFLENRVNISEEHRKIVFPFKEYKSKPSSVNKYFEQIPKDLALKLYEVYKTDFVLFNYDRPDYLN
ncbi:unnamed protein product [Clavelina lepadiformis]|uniref:Carbohydrate sulfotransferase n=1 Tax=Clavelina lepadiformis TaxID=159417 RepID=A0ABP0G7A8_CLALP